MIHWKFMCRNGLYCSEIIGIYLLCIFLTLLLCMTLWHISPLWVAVFKASLCFPSFVSICNIFSPWLLITSLIDSMLFLRSLKMFYSKGWYCFFALGTFISSKKSQQNILFQALCKALGGHNNGKRIRAFYLDRFQPI